jgi:hypothetical protein
VLGTAYAANPYHYAGNDPVNQVDPLGLRPVTDAELAGEHDSGGGLFSKIGHGVLDVAGLVPGVGEVADLANAAWYTAEGDYTMAALSAAAAIPFAGWAATGAKAAIKGTAAAEKLTAKVAIEGGGAVPDSVRIFRNVDAAEFDSIATTERFATGPGQMEGKWFATTGGHADQWGTLLNGGQGLTVETRVPRQVADQLHYHPGKLDGIGPGYYADGSQLDLINTSFDGIRLWP